MDKLTKYKKEQPAQRGKVMPDNCQMAFLYFLIKFVFVFIMCMAVYRKT
jgi:hypothetical protein